ncbi:MAG: hypothetical protein HQL72_14040 [Magnetococcales bacterium]|nr:hypothetical protein [Magnetococcales bacterium]
MTTSPSLEIVKYTNSGVVVKTEPGWFVRSLMSKPVKTIPNRPVSARHKNTNIVENASSWSVDRKSAALVSQYNTYTDLPPSYDLPQRRHLNRKSKFMFESFSSMVLAKEEGRTAMAISFNLSPARAMEILEGKAGLKEICPAFLKILTKHLKRRIDLILGLEMWIESGHSSHGRPHLHCIVLLDFEEEKAFRRAVREFNKDLSGIPNPNIFKQNECTIKKMMGMGWATYISKHTAHTRRFGFKTKDTIFVTRSIAKRAEEIFNQRKRAAPAKAADRSGSVLSIANHSTTQNNSNTATKTITSSSAARRTALLSAYPARQQINHSSKKSHNVLPFFSQTKGGSVSQRLCLAA